MLISSAPSVLPMTRVCGPARTISVIFFVGPACQTHVPPLPFQIEPPPPPLRPMPVLHAAAASTLRRCHASTTAWYHCAHARASPSTRAPPPVRRAAALHRSLPPTRLLLSSHARSFPCPMLSPTRAHSTLCSAPPSVSFVCARQVFDVLPQRKISSFSLRALHCSVRVWF